MRTFAEKQNQPHGPNTSARIKSFIAPVNVHPKLTVGVPEDAYEREADRVAERALRGAGQSPRAACACGGGCPGCERGVVQKKGDGVAATAAAPAMSGGVGSRLDDGTQSFMESRLGADFGSVRVHTGGEAARAARGLGARAFTYGSDIYFGEGEYRPDSEGGRLLLAHELAHVMQQRAGRVPQRVQRWAVAGCAPSQEEDLISAVMRAYDDLSAVLPLVTERPVTDDVKDALWLAFRDESVSTANLVRDNIRNLRSQVTGTRFTCADQGRNAGCDEDTLAYVPGSGPMGSVVICRPNFFADDITMLVQSVAVIHEAAHTYLSMEDRGYFSKNPTVCDETEQPQNVRDPGDPESGTAGDNPAHRLENADSYACFVYYLRYRTARRRHRAAAGLRGANLSLDADDLTFSIYTQTRSPEIHRFSITGAPENSRFRFRWSIRAGTRVYNPTSSESGADAGAFDERNTRVYVSNSLTRLLWDSGVRSATLVCEVELYRPHGDRFVPPTVVKEEELTVVDGEPPFNI